MYGYFTESNYKGAFPYTDLACERRRADLNVRGIDYRREKGICGIWERIRVSSPEGARSIGRPMGIYNTLQPSALSNPLSRHPKRDTSYGSSYTGRTFVKRRATILHIRMCHPWVTPPQKFRC